MQRRILITGAGRRLGLFLCEHFAAAGWQVLATSRRASPALQALAECGVEALKTDYSEASLQQLAKRVAAGGRLHALVHNASIYEKDEAHQNAALDFFTRLFHVHMAIPALLNEALRAALFDVDQPGVITHITDIYAENPNPDYSLYCATKAGLSNLSKSCAKKYAPGIRVNSIQPGPIRFLDSHSPDDKETVLGETLLPNEGGFLPIYQAIQALLENAYITGAAIKVDGGRSLGRG